MDEYMLGRRKDALAHLQRATALGPSDSEAFYYLGRLYFSADNPQDARIAFQRAIELDPNSVRAQNHLGQSFEALGHLPEAESAYLKAIAAAERQAKKSPWPYYNLGLLYLHQGRSGESIPHFRAALAADTNMTEARVKLAMALSNQKKLLEARDLLEEAVRNDPSNAEAHYRLGLLLAKLGNQSEAQQQLSLFEKYRK